MTKYTSRSSRRNSPLTLKSSSSQQNNLPSTTSIDDTAEILSRQRTCSLSDLETNNSTPKLTKCVQSSPNIMLDSLKSISSVALKDKNNSGFCTPPENKSTNKALMNIETIQNLECELGQSQVLIQHLENELNISRTRNKSFKQQLSTLEVEKRKAHNTFLKLEFMEEKVENLTEEIDEYKYHLQNYDDFQDNLNVLEDEMVDLKLKLAEFQSKADWDKIKLKELVKERNELKEKMDMKYSAERDNDEVPPGIERRESWWRRNSGIQSIRNMLGENRKVGKSCPNVMKQNSEFFK